MPPSLRTSRTRGLASGVRASAFRVSPFSAGIEAYTLSSYASLTSLVVEVVDRAFYHLPVSYIRERSGHNVQIEVGIS